MLHESRLDELAAAENVDALCRLLLAERYGWRRSTRHLEAVEILADVSPTTEWPLSLVAQLLSVREWRPRQHELILFPT